MRRTVALALERGVSIGAHPSYPDREGFGRRELAMPAGQIIAAYERQLEGIATCCEHEGARLRYVKPHGALYNRAARDAELAALLAESTARFDSSLTILTLPQSKLASAGHARSLKVAREAFVDRGYSADGSLVPRGQPGALIDDPHSAALRAVSIARHKRVAAIDGTTVAIGADSFCVHGDGAHAIATLTETRGALERAGFTIEPFAS